MDTTPGRLSAAEELHELLGTDVEIADFLNELARVAANELSGKFTVLCGITLQRDERAAVAGSSSDWAKQLDETQAGFDEGPCLTAQNTQTVIRVGEVEDEVRWADYMATIREHGLRSVLAVPIELDETAKAALNCYTTAPGAFDEADIEVAQQFAGLVSRAMRVALRIARHTEAAEDRRRAMESRTSIDVAVGIIMGQNRCSQDEAFNILTNISSNRNIKLRVLAQEFIAAIGQPAAITAFDE